LGGRQCGRRGAAEHRQGDAPGIGATPKEVIPSAPALRGDEKQGEPAMIRRLSAAALLVGVVVAVLPAATARKDDEKGWVQLFNRKDLTGWKLHPQPNNGQILEVIKKEQDRKVAAYYGKVKGDKEVPLWHVEEGVLIGSGPASHLFSERGDYQNFRYRVEAMI